MHVRSHCAIAHAQRLADFRARESLEHTEAEARALHIRKRFKLQVHASFKLQVFDLLIRRQRSVGRIFVQRGEQPMGTRAGHISGDVSQDCEEPRSEWTICVETGERLHDPAERLLNEIFSILERLRELPGDRERPPEIA